MIHQQLLTMSIEGKRKGNCGKVGGSVGQQRISGDSGEKTGKIYTMFGAGTSECIRDTQIIGTGRNRRGRFEGMSDSAVETAESSRLAVTLVKNYLETCRSIEFQQLQRNWERTRLR